MFQLSLVYVLLCFVTSDSFSFTLFSSSQSYTKLPTLLHLHSPLLGYNSIISRLQNFPAGYRVSTITHPLPILHTQLKCVFDECVSLFRRHVSLCLKDGMRIFRDLGKYNDRLHSSQTAMDICQPGEASWSGNCLATY